MTSAAAAASRPIGFNPDLPVMANAAQAWDRRQKQTRTQYEVAARRLARKVLYVQEIAISYDPKHLDLTTPTFEVENELFAYQHSTGQLALVELCEDCGDEVMLHTFADLTSLGRTLAQSEADPFMCRLCRIRAGR